jgi:hypothetical protein
MGLPIIVLQIKHIVNVLLELFFLISLKQNVVCAGKKFCETRLHVQPRRYKRKNESSSY